MQNIEEEEEIKNNFMRLLHQMVYEWRFEELINLINVKYPSFFTSNQNIFYIIMKFSFIKIILFQHDINAAQDFYSKYLTNMGYKHNELEEKLKEVLKVPNFSLFNNGTIALLVAIKAMNLPQGSEVITTPFTFAATPHCIQWNGLKPVDRKSVV